MEILDLSSNRLRELPEGLFAGLSNLMHLFLSHNLLGELPPGLFAGLSRLEDLTLGSNRLEDLPSGLFDGLSSLEHLLLYSNHMERIPAGLLAGLVRLNNLVIGGNDVTTLPDGLFSELNVLTHLEILLKPTANLPDSVFAGLTSLETLIVNRFGSEPLPFAVTLEITGDGQFKAVAPTGAPFALELSLAVSSGGEIAGGANSVTIPAGAIESAPISVTRVDVEADTATVDIAALPSLPEGHRGYILTIANPTANSDPGCSNRMTR